MESSPFMFRRLATRVLCSAGLALIACGRQPEPPRSARPSLAPEPASPADELACLQIVFFQHNGGAACAHCVETLPAEAERMAREAQRLLDQGADFTQLARTMASAPLGHEGDGVLGTFRRSEWPDTMNALREPAFALKVGEHAKQPLEIDYAYVLVRRCETGTPQSGPPHTL